ncbi:MAG: 3'-5' exonuclease [Acetobacteraceae bacterium]
MREIVLDTETTGLDPAQGHRLVELGCIELLNRIPTGATFHVYLNPERDVPAEASAIHGLTGDFLKDKPRFGEIADDFLAFIGEEAPLVIHNAGFDHGFLNAELKRAARAPLAQAAEALVREGRLSGRARESAAGLIRALARWRGELAAAGPVATLETILDESGYLEMWRQDRSPEAPGRIDNLKELGRALSKFETLAGFLDHVSLVMENDERAEGDRVSLMTLHAAKGLEFGTVFLPGWEEGVFPNQRALEDHGTKALEEERRLAYVGLTRAKNRVIVSHALRRQFYSGWQSAIPSRFIAELPEAEIECSGTASFEREQMLAALPVFSTVFPPALRAPRVRDVVVEERPRRATKIGIGERVFHQKFGYGTVTASEDDRLEIAFDQAGAKRVLERFVEPA